MSNIGQDTWPMPSRPMPIVAVGAGGIQRDAHLPAYTKAGFDVVGITDPERERAEALARDWPVGRVFDTLQEAVDAHGNDVVWDLATPPDAVEGILAALPHGAVVQIQKPMGGDLEGARRIRDLVHARGQVAKVNFQLRFAPMMLAAADLIRTGAIGDLCEIEAQVNVYTPWHMFPFLKGMERLEIALHSIHYLDLIRSIAGEPDGVFCRSLPDARSDGYTQTRTAAILDYGSGLRALVNTGHNHRGGARFQVAQFRFEGTKGEMIARLGVLHDYPNGAPDALWLSREGGEWEDVPLTGNWFPEAFAGSMAHLQRVAAGEEAHLISSAEDAFATMALVEACYIANDAPGTPIPG